MTAGLSRKRLKQGHFKFQSEPGTLCPVCGYELGFKAWDGGSPSHEICPSCGIQFGYQDAFAGRDEVSRGFIHHGWRTRWMRDGMPWSSGNQAPLNWNPSEQLKKVTRT